MKCNYCRATIADGLNNCPYCDKPIVPSVDNVKGVPVGQVVPNNQNMMNQVATPIQSSPQQPMTQQPVTQQPTMQAPPVVQQPMQVNVSPGSLPQNTPVIQPTPKKKSPVLLVVIICILVLGATLVFGISVLSKSLSENEITDPPQNTQTEVELNENRKQSDRVIMVYMIGSNLESENGAATSDVLEMIESKFNQDDLDILVYVGGAKRWKTSTFSHKENAIYEITTTDVKKIKAYDKKSMTLGTTLTEFLNYVYANYDSEKYSLILWDHGGGPIYGYGKDENFSNGPLNMIELDSAINKSSILKNGKLEFIGFDACLMSSVEIANILKEEAHYFIASSESEPAAGWDYNFLSEIKKDTTSEQLGQYIVDYYYNYFLRQSYFQSLYGYDFNPAITLSLIDLNKIDNLNTSINNLFKDLNTNIDVQTYSKISRDVSRATLYGGTNNGVPLFELIDLYDFSSELNSNSSDVVALQNAVKDAVIYHKTNIIDCNGISMYFPSSSRKKYNSLSAYYEKLIVAENYKSFLNRYTAISSGNKLVKSSIDTLTPNLNNEQIQATIPEDMAANYEKADYIVFRKIQNDESFLPVYISKDVTIDGNTINASISNRRIVVNDASGKNAEDVIAIEYSRDETSVTYELYTVLEKWDDNDITNTYQTEAVVIYLKVDNQTKKGQIVDIKQITNGEISTSAKISYNLNDWRTMKFASSSYYLYDNNGKKLTEWKNTNTMYGTEITIKDGYNFYADTLDSKEEYYYMFRIKDTQSNVYESNLVKAK